LLRSRFSRQSSAQFPVGRARLAASVVTLSAGKAEAKGGERLVTHLGAAQVPHLGLVCVGVVPDLGPPGWRRGPPSPHPKGCRPLLTGPWAREPDRAGDRGTGDWGGQGGGGCSNEVVQEEGAGRW
jgi:hypothetical protein